MPAAEPEAATEPAAEPASLDRLPNDLLDRLAAALIDDGKRGWRTALHLPRVCCAIRQSFAESNAAAALFEQRSELVDTLFADLRRFGMLLGTHDWKSVAHLELHGPPFPERHNFYRDSFTATLAQFIVLSPVVTSASLTNWVFGAYDYWGDTPAPSRQPMLVGTMPALASMTRAGDLASLALARNNLGALGAQTLGEALRENTTLVALDLAITHLCAGSDASAPEIGHYFDGGRANPPDDDENFNIVPPLNFGNLPPCIEHLRAGGDYLRPDAEGGRADHEYDEGGALTLIAAMREHPSLTSINLCANALGAKSGSALAAALAQSPTLTVANLLMNLFDEAAAAALVKAFKDHARLVTLCGIAPDTRAFGISNLEGCTRFERRLFPSDAVFLAAELAVRVPPRDGAAPRPAGARVTALRTLELRGPGGPSPDFVGFHPLLGAGAKAFASALRLNRSDITRLDLSCNKMDPEGAKLMGAALKHNTLLRTLLLDCNELGPGGGYAFAEGLLLNTTLIELSLRGNAIGMDAAAALVVAFKQHPCLSTLTGLIGSHQQAAVAAQIAADDCLLFAAELATNKSVETVTLNLSSHTAGSGRAACAIAEALRTNTTVRSLGITGGAVSAESGVALGAALRANGTLTDLRLRHNQLGAEGLGALAEMLLQNSTLASVDVAFNGLNPKSASGLFDRCAIDKHRTAMKAEALRLST